MAILKLTADMATAPARPGDCPGWILAKAAAPGERAEIASSGDAVREFEAFAAKIAATGAPAYCYATIANGHKAPRGFGRLELRRFLNV